MDSLSNNENMTNQNNFDTNMQNNYVPQEKNPTFTLYLILSILQLICCCQITGIISLIFTITANNAFNINDKNTYNNHTKYAKISLIVGLIVGIVCTILYTVLIFAAIAADM